MPGLRKSQTRKPLVVAIVGGSGSGKSWLADKLARALAPRVARISQDDFYRDRSHLAPSRRAQLNYDHPRAIDWAQVEYTLLELLAGRRTLVPCYDFKNHRRLLRHRSLAPQAIILIEGLWLLRRRSLRPLFGLSVFLECPTRTRLHRRLRRDLRHRGRNPESIVKQFWTTVEPMHSRYVDTQARWADLVVPGISGRVPIGSILAQIRARLNQAPPTKSHPARHR